LRLLAITDLHAEEEALEKVSLKLASERFDAVVLLGDITHNGPISFVEDAIAKFAATGAKVFAVMGNMDPPEVLDVLEREGASVHAKKVPLGEGWHIAGFGGCPAKGAHTPTEFSEDEIYANLKKLGIDNKTIVATHFPPTGISDFDLTYRGIPIGSDGLRKLIEEDHPAAVLCGHVHEREGIARFDGTLVVKVAPAYERRAAVIEIGKDIKATLVDL